MSYSKTLSLYVSAPMLDLPMILFSSQWLTRSFRLPEQILAPGLPGAQEARQEYQSKAHAAWEARQQHLSGFVHYHGRQMRSPTAQLLPLRAHRMEACRNGAESLDQISLEPCKPWSDEIFQFTSRAVGVLAFREEDTLQEILSLLVKGMTACAMLDHFGAGRGNRDAETIAVSFAPARGLLCTDDRAIPFLAELLVHPYHCPSHGVLRTLPHSLTKLTLVANSSKKIPPSSMKSIPSGSTLRATVARGSCRQQSTCLKSPGFCSRGRRNAHWPVWDCVRSGGTKSRQQDGSGAGAL